MRSQTWDTNTGIPNLHKLVESGNYYVRVKIAGKSLRHSLKTTDLKVAKRRMRDWLLEQDVRKEAKPGTWGSLIESYLVWLAQQDLQERTKDYKRELVGVIQQRWSHEQVMRTTTPQVIAWKLSITRNGPRTKGTYSWTRVNSAITVMRELEAHAVDIGVLPKVGLMEGVDFVSQPKTVPLQVPSRSEMAALRAEIIRRCKAGGRIARADEGHLLFDFLVYSGARIDSANHLKWQDIDWEHNRLTFMKTKRDTYVIPLFDNLRALLETIRNARPGEPGNELVFRTRTIRQVLDSACRTINLRHMSHHTLRHVFATRCIESGVDIPTISRWLGHKDGGALAMRVYGHLCDEHSQAQAKLVTF